MKANLFAMIVLTAVVCTVVFKANSVSAQETTHPGDSVARASALDAMDAAMGAHEMVRNDRTEIEAKIGKAQRLAESAALRGDKATEAKISSKLDEYKAELAEADRRLVKIEAELAKRGCGIYTNPAAQKECLKTLKAITADGEAKALETFQRVVRPPVQIVKDGDVETANYFAEGEDGALVAPNNSSSFVKLTRYSGGETPVYTEIQYGERTPLALPRLQGEPVNRGVHPFVKWVIPALVGGIAGGAAFGTAWPDDATGGSFSYGSAGKGTLFGVATGLAVSLIWEIAD